MDSTFISAPQCDNPMQDQSHEQALFDHTLDNMSMADGGDMTLSDLLRDKGSRSRFISDESFFAGNDVADKYIEEEELKSSTFSLFRPRNPEMERAPVDLLGIPMEDTEEEPPESTHSAFLGLS
jgi:hypothetical protein